MRYTTLIDISRLPIYKNTNARLLYLHLVLVCGYTDADRDLADISIRQLAREVGLTLSAVRHALHQLETSGLVQRQGPMLLVKKWLAQPSITARPKTEKAKKAAEIKQEEQQRRADLDAQRRAQEAQRDALRRHGKDAFMIYFEDLEKKAASGDMEAAAAVERHRRNYEMHAAAIQNEKKGN